MIWEIVPRDEQETIINIDYYDKKISVYTSRKQVGERLRKKLGEPTYAYSNDGRIFGVTYERNLFDKDVSKFFSKMLMVGTFRDVDNETEENEEDLEEE